MVVPVAVPQPAAVQDHAVVEERPVPFGDGLELLQEVGQLRHMEEVDLADLLQFLRVAAVVREVVVPFRNVDLPVAAVAAGVGKHQRCHARRVRLESQHEHVAHQPQVFGVILRNAGGHAVVDEVAPDGLRLCVFDPALDLADAGEVLVELALIGPSQLLLQFLGVIGDRGPLSVEFAGGDQHAPE